MATFSRRKLSPVLPFPSLRSYKDLAYSGNLPVVKDIRTQWTFPTVDVAEGDTQISILDFCLTGFGPIIAVDGILFSTGKGRLVSGGPSAPLTVSSFGPTRKVFVQERDTTDVLYHPAVDVDTPDWSGNVIRFSTQPATAYPEWGGTEQVVRISVENRIVASNIFTAWSDVTLTVGFAGVLVLNPELY